MGFSLTASHLIWGLAMFGAASGIAAAFFGVEHAVIRGEDAMSARAERSSWGQITGTFCYNATTQAVSATLTNAGRRELSLRDTTLILDGVPRMSPTWTVAAAGRPTDRWFPGEVAVGNLTGVLSAPARLYVSPPVGENAFIKRVTCP